MAENKKSLGVHLRIPIEAVGAFMAELGERAQAWGFQVVEALNPNTAHPQAARALSTGKARAKGARSRAQGKTPQRSTSEIALEIFQKADGEVVSRGTIADAFEKEGFSAKSAQTLLDRWVTAKKIIKTEPGRYKWKA